MDDPKDPGPASINEPVPPEGAAPPAPPAPPAEPETDRAPLPSDSELNSMTRVELNELAAERGIEDADTLATKADVIAALKET
jgi:hypothetical protein